MNGWYSRILPVIVCAARLDLTFPRTKARVRVENPRIWLGVVQGLRAVEPLAEEVDGRVYDLTCDRGVWR